MSDPVLACSNLTKHFQQGDTRVEVLKGIDFAIHAGERVAIDGRVVEISASKINVVEIVPDGLGGYMERPASLALNN